MIIKKILREAKKIVYDPLNYFPDLIVDIKKDVSSKNIKEKHNIIWCCGLPKSGSSLIEDIFDKLPYVRVDTSSIRSFDNSNLDHPHGISDRMFKAIPKNKLSFLKTHTHFDLKYIKIAEIYDAKIIVSLRDLRDVMISRYFHVMNEKIHWQHKYIKDLDFEEGFKKSLTYFDNTQKDMPIVINYNWIKNWLDNYDPNKTLILWYEDYIDNPVQYISEIIKFTKITKINPQNVYEKIKAQKKYNLTFEKNFSKYGKRKSTFRKGKSGSWKNLFNKEIEKCFYNNLPGNLEKILKKTI